LRGSTKRAITRFLVNWSADVLDRSNRGTSAEEDFRKRKNARGLYLWELTFDGPGPRWKRNWRASLEHLFLTGDWRWLLRTR